MSFWAQNKGTSWVNTEESKELKFSVSCTAKFIEHSVKAALINMFILLMMTNRYTTAVPSALDHILAHRFFFGLTAFNFTVLVKSLCSHLSHFQPRQAAFSREQIT